MPLPELSAQHLLFVQEYARDHVAVRAGLAAGLSADYQNAAEQASQLLKKPEIRRWLRHLHARQAKALKFKPSKVLRAWMLASTADLTYFAVGADGRLTTAPGVPKEYARCVRKVKYRRTETLRGKGDAAEIEVVTTAEIELRDPFGPECKLMEHFGELAGDDRAAIPAEVVGRVLARYSAELAAADGSARSPAGDEGVGPVGGEPRPPE